MRRQRSRLNVQLRLHTDPYLLFILSVSLQLFEIPAFVLGLQILNAHGFKGLI